MDSTNCVTNQLFTGTVLVRGTDNLSFRLSGRHKTDLDQPDLIASFTCDVKRTELMKGGQTLIGSAASVIILLCYITSNRNEVFQSNKTLQYSLSISACFSSTNHHQELLYTN
jgi:hypothetical protein